MISLRKRQEGFTIVELLIVIVIIGILATLVIVTFTGTQQKARDSQRQTDINAVNSHLASYYTETGHYPLYSELSDDSASGFIATNLKGLDPEAIKDPKGGAKIQSGAADATHYGYAVTCSVATDASTCDAYTLTAKLEKDGSTYTKKSN
jgi:prepilin-type N-terminal cleavage/methylation domain-containing protein